jgi:hypothetical protein
VIPRAKLRACGSCEWIFSAKVHGTGCPKCLFGSYAARHVYGNRCYRYAKTQEPWRNGQLAKHALKLDAEIRRGSNT